MRALSRRSGAVRRSSDRCAVGLVRTSAERAIGRVKRKRGPSPWDAPEPPFGASPVPDTLGSAWSRERGPTAPIGRRSRPNGTRYRRPFWDACVDQLAEQVQPPWRARPGAGRSGFGRSTNFRSRIADLRAARRPMLTLPGNARGVRAAPSRSRDVGPSPTVANENHVGHCGSIIVTDGERRPHHARTTGDCPDGGPGPGPCRRVR